MYYEKPKGVSVHGGFPNPATDASLQGIDFNKLLVRNSVSTYVMRLAGNDWQHIGMFDGDMVLIDRALVPKSTDLAVWWHNDSFAISPYHQLPEGSVTWGIVTSVIHQFRSKE